MTPSAIDLIVSEEPVPGLEKALTEGLTVHMNSIYPDLRWNKKVLQIPYYSPDAQGEEKKILGGYLGYTIMGHLMTTFLWVDESLRGKGIGESLMRKAEQVAKEERSCSLAFVDTMSFQAPSFYPRLGYRELYTVPKCFEREDITRIYFVKDL